MDGKSEEEFHHCGSKRTSVCSCVYRRRVFERFCSDLWINMCDKVTFQSPGIHFSLFMLQDFDVNHRFKRDSRHKTRLTCVRLVSVTSMVSMNRLGIGIGS